MAIKHVALGLALALTAGAATAPAVAQDGPKLYVFTSGSLGGFPKAALQMGGQGNIDWAPVSFYVLKHPKGNVMFDSGNNDKTITDPEGWWGPLAKGFRPEDDKGRRDPRAARQDRSEDRATSNTW